MNDATPSVACPPLSTIRVSVHARTLHRACEVLGGLDALSRHLDGGKLLSEKI